MFLVWSCYLGIHKEARPWQRNSSYGANVSPRRFFVKVCRILLRKLEDKGFITLPPSKSGVANSPHRRYYVPPSNPPEVDDAPWEITFGELPPIPSGWQWSGGPLTKGCGITWSTGIITKVSGSCGKKARRYQEVPRTLETLLGTSTITHAYYYCTPCKHGFYPLDATLGLSPRKKQDDLQSLALEFLAKMPFEEASALFLKATGISFSDNRMHGLFADFMADVTEEEVIPAADEIERRIRKVTGKGKRRPVLVAATDGAHTPTRPRGGGRETKWGPGEIQGSQRVSSLPLRQRPYCAYSQLAPGLHGRRAWSGPR